MNTNHTDESIRSLYRRLEPRVHSDDFCQAVGVRLASGQRRAARRRPLRLAVVTCVALAVVAAVAVAAYEGVSHLGGPGEIVAITDETSTTSESADTGTEYLPNPYPTADSAGSSGSTQDTPSTWAESLGKAILDFYPDSDWEVLRAVELAGGGAMDVALGPRTTTYGPPSLDGTDPRATGRTGGPFIRVQVNREESGHFPQEGNPMQYEEFVTEYGHGLLGPVYNYGSGRVTLLTWFIRPDKLFLRVSARLSASDAAQSSLALDEAGVRELVEYVASIIAMGSTGATSTTTSTPTTPTTAVSDEVQGYLDTLESVWKAAGIPVLAVNTIFPDAATEKNVNESTEEGDPLPWAVVEIPSSVFDSMDYLFTLNNIDRQTMVAVRSGVPLQYLGIMMVREDGSKTLWNAGQVATPNPEWDQPASLALTETSDRLREAALQAATKAGVVLESVEVTEDASGRLVEAAASIPERETVSATVAGFNGPLEEAVRALNKEGAKISGLYVKVDDLSGAPVLRFALGLGYGNDGARSGRWLTPQLKALLDD